MNENELLEITSEIGYLMIKYGAEIFRVEDSIKRIISAYGTDKNIAVEVFAIPASLIVTIQTDGGFPITQTKRIISRCTNLDRVDKLNSLSRNICRTKPDFETVMKHIEEIKKRSEYGFKTIVISYAVVGFTFALFFGGGIKDAVIAGIIGALIKLVSTLLEKIKPSIFLESVVCSILAASLAIISMRIGITERFDKIIIGSLMTLVPGITITNCMRDFIAGDFLAGLYTMTEALIIAAGMAVGAATTISFLTGA